jgi:pilus assembly protein Flp/PilA
MAAKTLTNRGDGRYIGAQDALLGAGGNDGVMPYISNEGKYTMTKLLKRLWQEEEGQDLVEYGLLVVLIALFAIGAMSGLATGVSTAFSKAAANLTAAT